MRYKGFFRPRNISKYKGDHIGQFGNCEGFSLSGTKMITSAEGGIITSNDTDLIEKNGVYKNLINLQNIS